MLPSTSLCKVVGGSESQLLKEFDFASLSLDIRDYLSAVLDTSCLVRADGKGHPPLVMYKSISTPTIPMSLILNVGDGGGIPPLPSGIKDALVSRYIANNVLRGEIKSADLLTPGFLDTSRADCGTVRAWVRCPTDPSHPSRSVMNYCYRAGCPVCWGKWVSRAAARASDVVEGYRRATRSRYFARHISLSPPMNALPGGLNEEDVMRWVLNEANRLIDGLGIVAAAIIAHPYRLKEEVKRFVNDASSHAHVNRYVWAQSQPNPLDYLYFSPHVHAQTFGRLTPSDEFEAETGWVYRNHDPHGGRDAVGVRRTLAYLLTHAWVRGNAKAVRYWRGMSSHWLGCDVSKEWKPDTCTVCGTRRVRVGLVPSYWNDYAIERWASILVMRRWYFVRSPHPPRPRPPPPLREPVRLPWAPTHQSCLV